MWRIFHHWAIPLVGAIVWWAMLIALLTCWAVQGHPRYSFVAKDKSILFISDIAATSIQGIFIAGCCTTALCYFLALISERYLRHAGRLLPNYRRREKVMAAFAIFFGIIGQLGIIFTSTFNTHIFSTVHVSMLCVFLGGTGISALFTIAEFAILDRSYKDATRLKGSYLLKGLWFVVALVLAILFGVFSLHGDKNVAAVFEWCLAFSWGFYLLTLVYDLYPAAKTVKGQLLERKLANQAENVAQWIPGMHHSDQDTEFEPKENDSPNLDSSPSTYRGSHMVDHSYDQAQSSSQQQPDSMAIHQSPENVV